MRWAIPACYCALGNTRLLLCAGHYSSIGVLGIVQLSLYVGHYPPVTMRWTLLSVSVLWVLSTCYCALDITRLWMCSGNCPPVTVRWTLLVCQYALGIVRPLLCAGHYLFVIVLWVQFACHCERDIQKSVSETARKLMKNKEWFLPLSLYFFVYTSPLFLYISFVAIPLLCFYTSPLSLYLYFSKRIYLAKKYVYNWRSLFTACLDMSMNSDFEMYSNTMGIKRTEFFFFKFEIFSTQNPVFKTKLIIPTIV